MTEIKEFIIVGIILIILGISMIVCIRNENHFLTPLAVFGGIVSILTGFLFLFGVLP